MRPWLGGGAPQGFRDHQRPQLQQTQPAITEVEVEVILDVWAGREDELFVELERKYARTNNDNDGRAAADGDDGES